MTAKFLVVLAAMASAASANFAGHGRHPPFVATTMCARIPEASMPYGPAIDYSGCSTINMGCALGCLNTTIEGRHLSLSCSEQANGTYVLVPTIPGTLPSCSGAPSPPPDLLCTLDCGANGECGFVGAEQRCFCSNGFYGLACEFDAAAQIGNLTVALEDCNTNFTLCETDLATCEAGLTAANGNYTNALTTINDIVTNSLGDPVLNCIVIVTSTINDLVFPCAAGGVQLPMFPVDPIGGSLTYYLPIDTTVVSPECNPTSVSCGGTITLSNNIVCTFNLGQAFPPLAETTVTCV